jgi:mannan endo-1,4-beta-mannosidase
MMERRPERAEWRELTTPGTRLHRQWREQVERNVVPYLAALRDARVPVLWRPYHEMNGIWFWWCGQAGPEGLARLWRNLWELLTVTHGLDNLLWVWNANAPRDRPGDEALPYPLFYPGGDVVDVLASDVYHDDWRVSHHDLLLELADGRPIAIGECGQLPTPATLDQQRRWAWFMPWGVLAVKINPAEKLRALYNDPRVLCHGDARRDAQGTWTLAR